MLNWEIYRIIIYVFRIGGGFLVPADLHCHTKLSDGSTGIDELIYLARRMKINTISVTDHDTFAGAKRAKIIGQRYGIEVIMGAEISSFHKESDKEVHILCYMCDATDRLEGLFKKIGEKRQKLASLVLQKLIKFYPISVEMVSKKAQGSTNVFINHIIQAIMDTGYALPYGILFEKIFGKSLELPVKSEYPSVQEVIEQIHEANGLAVLAHPQKSNIEEKIHDFIDMGLDGIEIWHPSADKESVERLSDIAFENGLLMTGGSDFHGMYSKWIHTLGSYGTPEDKIEEMRERKQKICKKI